eukprot:scaffold275022_cov36-Prasinocladus_malaysianus.AAC.1
MGAGIAHYDTLKANVQTPVVAKLLRDQADHYVFSSCHSRSLTMLGLMAMRTTGHPISCPNHPQLLRCMPGTQKGVHYPSATHRDAGALHFPMHHRRACPRDIRAPPAARASQGFPPLQLRQLSPHRNGSDS